MTQSESQIVMALITERGPMSVYAVAKESGLSIVQTRNAIGYLRASGRLKSSPRTYGLTELGRTGELRAYRRKDSEQEPAANDNANQQHPLATAWGAPL